MTRASPQHDDSRPSATTARRSAAFGLCLLLGAAPVLSAAPVPKAAPDSVSVATGVSDSWAAMAARDAAAAAKRGMTGLPTVIPAPLMKLSKDVEDAPPGISPARPTAPAAADSLLGAQTASNSFQAITLQDQFNAFAQGSTPPDTMGAAGPTQFIEVINSSVAIYSKATGTRASHVALNTFFAATIDGVAYPRNGAFDTRVLYDRRSARFFACALERGSPNNSSNHVILAVSASSDPSGSWFKYVVPLGVSPNGTTTNFTDFDTLAVDENGVYLAARIFPSTAASFAKIAAMLRAPLLSNTASTVYQWTGITDMFSTPQPAHNFDDIGPTGIAWFVSSSTTANGDLRYRRLTWDAGTPTLDAAASTVATPVYGNLLNAPALGSSTDISVGDDRIQMAVIRDGRLWTCRHVGVNASGGSTAADRDGCEWLEVSVTGATPALVQSGRVYDPAAANFAFYYYPSVMVNGQGHAAMGFSGSMSTQHVGAYYAGRLSTNEAGSMDPPILIKAGEASYTRLDGSGRNRWGDYSYTSLDPSDDMSLWTIQEYAESISVNIWGTWITRLVSPAPSFAPVSASAFRGDTGVSVNLAGDGFYDPPADVPSRLAVALTGGSPNGISNLAILSVSPTNVLVTFDVGPGAAPGTRAIVLTNPDGQQAVAPAGFTVLGIPLTLTVASEYGGCTPATGAQVFAAGTVVTGIVAGSPAVVIDPQSRVTGVCTGWTGTGSAPAAGSGTNTGPFTLATDSSLTWLWVVTDLALSNQTVTGSVQREARDTVSAGDGYRVVAPGSATLRAGRTVRLAPGFSASTGSAFRAVAP